MFAVVVIYEASCLLVSGVFNVRSEDGHMREVSGCQGIERVVPELWPRHIGFSQRIYYVRKEDKNANIIRMRTHYVIGHRLSNFVSGEAVAAVAPQLITY